MDSSRGFVEFQREPIRVLEEGKSLVGGLVDADRFGLDAMGVEMGDRLINIADFERQVPKSLGLRVAESAGCTWKGKELDLNPIWEGEIDFPGIPLCPVVFRHQLQSENLGIEALGPGVI